MEEEEVPNLKKEPETPDKTDENLDSKKRDNAPDAKVNTHMVQITASNAEIARRISALIDRKQCEVDDENKREFCGVHPSLGEEEDNGCARTKAVFVPRAGGKSHIKVSRVVNMYGPQTRALCQVKPDLSPYKPTIKQEVGLQEGIEERLANMEDHLKMKGSYKKDLYTRLKVLEERILFLEGLSPEYFASGPPTPKKDRRDARTTITDSRPQDMNLEELQDRMKYLKEMLMNKGMHS